MRLYGRRLGVVHFAERADDALVQAQCGKGAGLGAALVMGVSVSESACAIAPLPVWGCVMSNSRLGCRVAASRDAATEKGNGDRLITGRRRQSEKPVRQTGLQKRAGGGGRPQAEQFSEVGRRSLQRGLKSRGIGDDAKHYGNRLRMQ